MTSKMNKSLKAFLLGYIRFDVNGHRFWRYNDALNFKNDSAGDVSFTGFSVFRGWVGFYHRLSHPVFTTVSLPDTITLKQENYNSKLTTNKE